jgi:hypothetical protein
MRRRTELAVSLSALAAALAATNLADRYVDRIGETAPVSPDFLLNRLPAVDLSAVYWWGAAAFILFATSAAVLRERERLAFIARSYALLMLFRAGLMILTPLHIPQGAVSVDSGLIYTSVGRHLTTHNDLFFSMHTAMPFLGALVFRDRLDSAVCLAFSVLMAATVLLLKTHYSLDVAGAFLVTYAVYKLQERWLEPLFGGRDLLYSRS